MKLVDAIQSRLWPKILLIWLIAAAVLLAIFGRAVIAGTPSDSDDYFRLLQVRDWLAGQSWWDVTQYRMNPPAGAPMHWSRVVDLPIAAGLLLLAPLGRPVAEAITTALVPLLLLGALLAVATRALTRLFEGQTVPAVGAALLLASGYVLVQNFPGRIDHHGWQILMAAVALAALLDPRQARSGAVAGTALALWLNISIEGLPFTLAAAGLPALRWIAAPGEARRLAAFMLALAGVSILLFAGMHPPSAWGQRWCDAVTPAHLASLAIAASSIALLCRYAAAWRPVARIVALAAVAAAAAAVFAVLSPDCLQSPFGHLDPLVQRIWYRQVMEGQPVWRQSTADALQMLYFPAAGILGALYALRRAPPGEARRNWLAVLALALAAAAVAMMIRRATGVAHVMAVPGALALIELLRSRASQLERPATRILASVAAFVLPSPLPPIYAAGMFAEPTASSKAAPDRLSCDMRCALAEIAALPPADILAPIDNGAAVLAFSRHRIVAGPYHRSGTALADVIRAFTGTPAEAHAVVARRRIAYVMIEPDSSEAGLYRAIAPDGMMARLARGKAPAWLAPVPIANGPLRLWKVIG